MTRLLGLYGQLGEAVADTLRRHALRDPQSRKTFEALTGRSVTMQALPELKAHNDHVATQQDRARWANGYPWGGAAVTRLIAGMFGFVGRAWLEGIMRANAAATTA